MKITTGFSPIEAGLMLQMCHHSSGLTSLQPKIPVQIPQPNGWGVLKSFSSPTTNIGFQLWHNQVKEHQYAIVFESQPLDIARLTNIKTTRMVPARVALNGESFSLSPESRARCNVGLLEHFQNQLPLLLEALSTPTAPFELYLAGHGDAAAMATFLLSAIHQNNLPLPQPHRLKTYIFGSPRIGNAAYTNRLNQVVFNNEEIDSLAFHLINIDDVVCELPQNLSLAPKVKKQVNSFRLQLISFISKMLYAGISGADIEPYKSFGTPVLLSGNDTTSTDSPIFQHDMRRYFQLMQQNFPV